jgi:putative transposase
MPLVEQVPSRKPLRAPSWDYAQPASYMVTICVNDRLSLLGSVWDDAFHPSDAGLAIEASWREIPERFGSVEIDSYVIMPNHLHGILHLHHDLPGLGKCSLGDVMKWFKGASARRYSLGVAEKGWPRFRDRFWQRNYYETIIRSEAMLEKFRRYIETNPSNWIQDPENTTR